MTLTLDGLRVSWLKYELGRWAATGIAHSPETGLEKWWGENKDTLKILVCSSCANKKNKTKQTNNTITKSSIECCQLYPPVYEFKNLLWIPPFSLKIDPWMKLLFYDELLFFTTHWKKKNYLKLFSFSFSALSSFFCFLFHYHLA